MKPGVKTTEFYIVLAAMLYPVIEAIKLTGDTMSGVSVWSFEIDPELMKWSIGAAIAYAGSRGISKINKPSALGLPTGHGGGGGP